MEHLKTLTIVLCLTTVHGHMPLSDLSAARSTFHPYAANNIIDCDITSPLLPSGSDYPCKGSFAILGTSQAAPSATWVPGKTYNMDSGTGACKKPSSGFACVILIVAAVIILPY